MLSYTAVGRSFFSRVIGTVSLGQGVEGWKGFYQSIRPTQMGLSVIVGQISLVSLQNFYYLSNFLVQIFACFKISECCIFSIADISSTAFIQPMSLIQFVMEILNKDNPRTFGNITNMDYAKVSNC